MAGYTVGEVRELLREEFPQLTVSKLRFLESEGLVCPSRSEANYRLFSEADVARLRFVLGCQRDRFLPLKAIREELGAGGVRAEQDLPPAGDPPPPSDGGSVLPVGADPSEVAVTEQQLCGRSGLRPAQVYALAQAGMVSRVSPQTTGRYDADDVAVACAAAELLDLGLEVRHLRLFKQSADRVAGFVGQLVGGLPSERVDDRLAAAASAAGSLSRACLVRSLRGLRR